MVYIVNVLSFVFAWLFKRVSLSLAFLPPKVFIFSMFMFGVGLSITALASFFYFLTTIVNNLYEIFDKIKNTSSLSGSAYGISLSSILNVFWGFLNSSGLLDAFNTSLSLFFTLLFSYVSIRIMFTFYSLWMSLVKGLTDQINSIERTIK